MEVADLATLAGSDYSLVVGESDGLVDNVGVDLSGVMIGADSEDWVVDWASLTIPFMVTCLEMSNDSLELSEVGLDGEPVNWWENIESPELVFRWY